MTKLNFRSIKNYNLYTVIAICSLFIGFYPQLTAIDSLPANLAQARNFLSRLSLSSQANEFWSSKAVANF